MAVVVVAEGKPAAHAATVAARAVRLRSPGGAATVVVV